jgi:chromosome segregation ATPase
MKAAQTAAAIAARRRQTQDKLGQVEQAIAQLRRERGRLTVRFFADRAGVSATFLYENSDGRVLVQQAATDGKIRRDRAVVGTHERIEASWRERALNAAAALGRTQQEVLTQRQRIGELMGQFRDTEQMVPGDSVQATLTENTSLKRRVQQLTQEHRALQERLDGARSNLRFAETRIAALEVQLLEPEQAQS